MVSTVQKSYRKNILREMKSSISRVVSLFGIVALGVMMLTGLMCIAPDMRTAAQKYYVQQNVFDLQVLSTLGLSQGDIDAIAAVDGVDAVQAVKYQDVEGHWTGDEQTTVARLYQLPADPQADTPENMNRPVLLSGRMPEAAGECVVHVMGHGSPVELGTQLTLPEETEGVSGQVFTVVGTVQDPLHFSSDSESSTVGDGQLDCILFVPEGTLTADYYTVCYIKAENAGLYDNYSDEYQAAVDAVAENLKAIQSVQCTARREELMDTANDKLTEARAEYDSQKAEAERQFAEAEAKLADAQQQLDAAKAQLEAGEKELAAQKAALPDTMQSGADKLVSSEAQVLEFEEQLQQIELLVNLKKVADPLLSYAEAALRNAEKALDEAEPEDEDYIELRDALAKAQAAYDNIYNQLQGYQQQLDAGKRQMYKQGLISSPNLSNDQLVTEAKAALRKMKLQLLQGQLQLTTGTASAYTQFDAAQKQLEEGWAEYNAGQTQLEESRTEYESRKAEAEQKLADGLAQLNDAEEQVSQIKKGEWYVLDRTSTMSCVTFAQYADRMDAIARVFPVFFPCGGAGGYHHHGSHGGRKPPANGHLKGAGLLQLQHRGQVFVLRDAGHHSGQYRRHGGGLCGVPYHYLERLSAGVQPAYLHPVLLPGHGSRQRGHQRRRHRLCHMVCLPFQSGRKDRSFAAAPGSRGGQAHPDGAHHPAVVPDVLLPKDHRPQPVPV